MTILIPIIIVLLACVASWLLLRRSRNALRRAIGRLDRDWSDIEIFIKQRNDDIPRLLQTCRSYLPGAHPAIEGVTQARRAYQDAAFATEKSAENVRINSALHALFAAAGKTEGLAGNNAYIQLHGRLSDLEEKIDERCDLYNDDIARFNARLAGFPGRLFAGKGRLNPRPPVAVGQAAARAGREMAQRKP